MIFEIKNPLENFGLEEQNGAILHNRKPLSCNGHSEKNISLKVKKTKMELLFMIYKTIVH